MNIVVILVFILSLIFLFSIIWLVASIKGKGTAGEKVVSYYLNKLDKDKYFVVNDITLKVDGKTTQIDHIVISSYGIFVIETKNWKGSVYGSRWGKYVYQYLGGKKFKHLNPVKQNDWHIRRLRQVLNEYSNLNYISVVAFSGYTKRKIKDDITIKISQVLDTILDYKEEVISEEVRDRIYRRLSALKVNGENFKKEHIENVRGVNNERR
jgi:hypothetical protein